MRSNLKAGQDGFKTAEPEILPAAWAAVGFINALKKYKDYLRQKYKVREMGIFGSYAKNEQNRESDLDVLVEFYNLNFSDYRHYVTLCNILSRSIAFISNNCFLVALESFHLTLPR